MQIPVKTLLKTILLYLTSSSTSSSATLRRTRSSRTRAGLWLTKMRTRKNRMEKTKKIHKILEDRPIDCKMGKVLSLMNKK